MAIKPVLLVEDEGAIRECVQMALEMENFPVVSCSNGKQALEVLSRMPAPGLILLDLMMPVMNGWQFLEEFQRHQEWKGIKVAVFTAFPLQKANLPEFCELLMKPLDLSVLLNMARRYCAENDSGVWQMSA